MLIFSSLSGPQLSTGKQEAFEIFIRDHEDQLTIEDNKSLLKQRSVVSNYPDTPKLRQAFSTVFAVPQNKFRIFFSFSGFSFR